MGNVVAAAVILPTKFQLPDLTDSKKLNEKKRETLYSQITEQCYWSVAEASSIEIDKIDILKATMLAMKRAINKLKGELLRSGEEIIFKVLVDGNRSPDVPNCLAIVKGDLIKSGFLTSTMGPSFALEVAAFSEVKTEI